jgi:hypothetical protein
VTDEAVDINLSKGYRVHPVTTADKRAELDGARLVAVVGVKQVRPQELLSSSSHPCVQWSAVNSSVVNFDL